MVKKFHLNTSLDIMIRGHSKSTFVDERGCPNKNEQGDGDVLACVSFTVFHFFKKNAEISKMKFYNYSLRLFLIDYNDCMKY